MSDIAASKAGAVRFWDEVFNKCNFTDLKSMGAGYTYNGGPQSNEAFMNWVLSLHASMPDLHVVVDEILAEDNKVALRWHAKGTAVGINGYEAGTKVEWTGTNILVKHANGFSNDQNGFALYTPLVGKPVRKDDQLIYTPPVIPLAAGAVSS
jgi:predicted ester cyclase